MRAGGLRRPVQIQDTVVTGGVKKFYTLATVWASVDPLRGTELARELQPQNVVYHDIRIRYRDGIRPRMRVLTGTRTLNIESVYDVESRHKELQILATEVVS